MLLSATLMAGLLMGFGGVSPTTASAAGGTFTAKLAGGTFTAPIGVANENNINYFDLHGSTTEHVSLALNGPADTDAGFYTYLPGKAGCVFWDCFPTVTLAKKNHNSTRYWDTEPRVDTLNILEDGANDVPLYIPAGVTPGEYKLSMTIRLVYNENKEGVQDPSVNGVLLSTQIFTGGFTVNASTSNSRNTTTVRVSGKKGSKSKLSVRVIVPAYMHKAKVTAYFKAKGSQSYKAVGTSTVSAASNSYAKADFKTSKGTIRKAGTFYVKVAGVPYASTYNSKSKTIK